MTKLLLLKENIKRMYTNHDVWIKRILKFVMALAWLVIMWVTMGYNPIMRNPIAIVAVAIICALIPMNGDILVLLVAMLAHLYSLSAELAGVTLILFLIMYLIYFKFTKKDAIIIVLLPLLFFIKIPYVIPLVLALSSSPIALIPILFGTIVYYVADYAASAGDSSFGSVISIIFNDGEFVLTVVCIVIVFMIVYIIRRLSINHSHATAVLVGGAANIVIMLVGNLVLDSIKIAPLAIMLIGTIISVFIAFVLHFAILALDYSRTEYTQFEDDEYYYYVKAVPKIKVTSPEINVKRINVQKVKRK